MKKILIFAVIFLMIASASVLSSSGYPFEMYVHSTLKTPIAMAENDLLKRNVNLLNNSGFEQGLDGWKATAGVGAEISVDSTVFHSGSSSLRFKQSGAPSTRLIPTARAVQTVSINQTAKHFIASGWAKSKNATAATSMFELLVQMVYTDATSDKFNLHFSHGTHGWEYNSLFLSAREDKKIEYILCFLLFQELEGTAWFDDMSLVCIDTYVRIKLVDSESKGVADGLVKVFSDSELFGEKYTDQDGIADFLLAGNKTYNVIILLKGRFVTRKSIKITEDVELEFFSGITFRERDATFFLTDILGQPLSSISVEVHFRPITSTESFLVGQFLADSNGRVLCSLLEGPGEVSVFFENGGSVEKGTKIIIENSDTDETVKFGVVKFVWWILPASEFSLYGMAFAFVAVGAFVLSYDVYVWKKSFGKS